MSEINKTNKMKTEETNAIAKKETKQRDSSNSRSVKTILNERKEIEEKLTNAEIAYNKVNFKFVTLKNELRSTNKIITRTSDDGLEKLHVKEAKLADALTKSQAKLDKLINAVDVKDKEMHKNNIFAQKQEVKKIKKDIKVHAKRINKYEHISHEAAEIKAVEIQKKIDAILPDVEKRKAKVSDYRKRYKALNKEWSEAFPDEDDSIAISVNNLDIHYGKKQAIFGISLDFPKNKVISIIGPSGCGKSTLLKALNRINDEIPSYKAEGEILFQNEINVLTLENVHDSSHKITLPELRTKIGMVFQQPNPFPMSIYNNVAYGPKINGIKNKSVLKEIVIESLKYAAIYEQVKDNLNAIATGLSGGQQQRLCIARAIANRPDILLMDEPTSALDPIAAKKVEDLILKLKEDYTVIMVTHSMQQAKRISDYTAFLYQGELVEYGETEQLFTQPKDQKTSDYINGKFG